MTRNERWQRNRAALQTALHDEDLVRIEAHAYRQQLLDDAQQAIDDDLRILHSVIRGFPFLRLHSAPATPADPRTHKTKPTDDAGK